SGRGPRGTKRSSGSSRIGTTARGTAQAAAAAHGLARDVPKSPSSEPRGIIRHAAALPAVSFDQHKNEEMTMNEPAPDRVMQLITGGWAASIMGAAARHGI